MSISRDAQRLLRQKAWFDKNGNEHSRLMAQYIFMQMQLMTEHPPKRGSYRFYANNNPMHRAIQAHLGFDVVNPVWMNRLADEIADSSAKHIN